MNILKCPHCQQTNLHVLNVSVDAQITPKNDLKTNRDDIFQQYLLTPQLPNKTAHISFFCEFCHHEHQEAHLHPIILHLETSKGHTFMYWQKP